MGKTYNTNYNTNKNQAIITGMIELPKDADGEYIHIGDVME